VYSVKHMLEESMPVLVLATSIAVATGLVLSFNRDFISVLPGVLIIIPSFNQMNGAISSVLSCRLSSALHLGLIHPKLHRTKTLDRNVLATYLTALVSFSAFGLIAWMFNTALGTASTNIWVFMGIVLLAGMLTTVALSVMSIMLSYVSYRKGMDPDNWVIPLMTSIGDFMGISLLLITAGLAV